MILKNINHPFSYKTEKICAMFFPLERIKDEGESDVEIEVKRDGDEFTVSADVYGKTLKSSAAVKEDEDESMTASLLLFSVLSKLTGFTPPWGVLYGVRPVRLLRSKCETVGDEGARKYFLDSLVSRKKTDLTFEVMKNQDEIINLSGKNSFSLYISIPFCPTRCDYCSFVSHSIEHAGELAGPYVDLLSKELEIKGKTARELNLHLETIYIGGGTPTTLTAAQLDKILTAVENNFDLTTLREFTVEAGRPDTVTEEKLRVLKAHKVGRISINPQTFDDEVRRKAGRRHTTQQTLDAFNLARKAGFDDINMDFIAGLDGDTPQGFEKSVEKAISLGAESITVHNLALKSGAYLVTEKKYYDFEKRLVPSKMVALSSARLREAGYHPYYMYRQSKSLGNLENVGWCKEGCECLYNIYMMDETHSVLSAGAGAVTMLKDQNTGHIERLYNFKYPYEYINKFDDVISRNAGIYKFYKA